MRSEIHLFSHGFSILMSHTVLEGNRYRACYKQYERVAEVIFQKISFTTAKFRSKRPPCGNNINRVDIEINADNFYLLIEVKIDAREQDSQISRYCFDAKNRAISRPWGVIF